MEQNKKDILDDYDLFINTFIGDRWHKIPATKKMFILTQFEKIQKTVKNTTLL